MRRQGGGGTPGGQAAALPPAPSGGPYLALCSAPLALALAGPRPPGRDFRTELAVALGFLALTVMCLQFLLAAAAFGRRRWRIPYEAWRRSHAALAAATLVFATLHILTERHYLALPWKRNHWAGYTALWIGTVAWVTLFGSPFADTEHPFSFSGSAERPARLEFTIKALGAVLFALARSG